MSPLGNAGPASEKSRSSERVAIYRTWPLEDRSLGGPSRSGPQGRGGGGRRGLVRRLHWPRSG